jgi:hypothetical protein
VLHYRLQAVETPDSSQVQITGKSDEELKAALGTNDAGEIRFEESAIKVREDGGIPVGFPESVSSFESIVPQALEGFEMGIEELKERAGAWIAGPVSGGAGVGPWQRPDGQSSAAHEEARRNPSSRTALELIGWRMSVWHTSAMPAETGLIMAGRESR